jgi:DNA-binding transcriptional LysR family regulator
MRGLEIRHLRYFVAVAEELSFSKAATRLHMSQPPLSQQIKALEVGLGVTLFDRSRREVHLTEAGKILLAESKQILSSLNKAVSTTVRAASNEGGTVKLGFVTSAMFHVLPTIFKRVSNCFPGLEISVYDMSSRDQVEALLQERLDIGVIHSCPSVSGLNKVPIYTEPFILALPVGHELESSATITAEQLEKYPLIGFSREYSPSLYDAQVACCLAKGFRPTLVHHARTPLTIFQLIRLGLGISLVPKPYSRSPFPGIVFKELEGSAGQLHLFAVWRDDVSSERVKKVVEQIMFEPLMDS